METLILVIPGGRNSFRTPVVYDLQRKLTYNFPGVSAIVAELIKKEWFPFEVSYAEGERECLVYGDTPGSL
ncbi:hypothetical protein F0562_021490 [Nyssa sinensis]|uniref:Uncharacterized protein n=1 Tax=Nyssa sinensis TaxID=561372 RepID=A0A5J5BIN5_9ASTE|nr:hypothetical protein F0562_021490 [Nyssa sinensis]